MIAYKYLPFLICVIAILGAFAFLFSENDRLRKANITLESTISRQNKEIQAQKLELESYVCDIESMKEFAIREYERAFEKTKHDKTCEGRIKHLENILKSYED